MNQLVSQQVSSLRTVSFFLQDTCQYSPRIFAARRYTMQCTIHTQFSKVHARFSCVNMWINGWSRFQDAKLEYVWITWIVTACAGRRIRLKHLSCHRDLSASNTFTATTVSPVLLFSLPQQAVLHRRTHAYVPRNSFEKCFAPVIACICLTKKDICTTVHDFVVAIAEDFQDETLFRNTTPHECSALARFLYDEVISLCFPVSPTLPPSLLLQSPLLSLFISDRMRAISELAQFSVWSFLRLEVHMKSNDSTTLQSQPTKIFQRTKNYSNMTSCAKASWTTHKRNHTAVVFVYCPFVFCTYNSHPFISRRLSRFSMNVPECELVSASRIRWTTCLSLSLPYMYRIMAKIELIQNDSANSMNR